ncbi:MAG: DUF3567 domain-containing protein [Rhodoferax sp.]|jgi:hypothetical protein|nr:DUF3567 domain-containing protein [Rhodoferax sp.]MCL4738223.1 DUF3567 family protein [Burkholderiaceae bacterium]MCP5289311.1 DUF3567 domain-containing protein [Burkholderiaceae bacterium]
MQMLYNSDSYVVVRFDVPGDDEASPNAQTVAPVGRGGYEIVDKLARREIFIDGALAESFKRGVQALAETDPSPEAYDDFIARYCALAQHPVTLH